MLGGWGFGFGVGGMSLLLPTQPASPTPTTQVVATTSENHGPVFRLHGCLPGQQMAPTRRGEMAGCELFEAKLLEAKYEPTGFSKNDSDLEHPCFHQPLASGEKIT